MNPKFVFMKNRKQKEQQLRDELSRSMLISDEDRMFWNDQLSTLPDALLEIVLREISESNGQVDAYVEAALEEDKDHKYLSELKEKIKQMKEKAFAMEEGVEKESAEETLEQQLEDL